MFRNEYIAKVGFTKVLDLTCSQCGGIFSSSEKSHCPKCNRPLVQPTVQTKEGIKPYCFTEVTIYPMMPEDEKKRYAEGIQKSGSLPFVIRLKIWGRYDQQNNIAVPDGRTPYLTPKKEIRVTLNHPPQLSIFQTREQQSVVQMLYTIQKGDTIQFLGPKETVAASTEHRAVINTPPPVTNPNAKEIAEMSKMLEMMTTRLTQLTTPAPVPVVKQEHKLPAEPMLVETHMEYIGSTSDAPDPSICMGVEDYERDLIDLYNN